MGRLDGKVAAITGGASGIGEATARRFVDEGARVAFADRDGARGSDIAEQIKASGRNVLFVVAHIEREAEASAFIERTVDHFGQLDILVNNAAIRMYQDVTEASEESWDTILGVNVKGYAFVRQSRHPGHASYGQRQHCKHRLKLCVHSERQGGTVRYDKGRGHWFDSCHGPRSCRRRHPSECSLPRTDLDPLP